MRDQHEGHHISVIEKKKNHEGLTVVPEENFRGEVKTK